MISGIPLIALRLITYAAAATAAVFAQETRFSISPSVDLTVPTQQGFAYQIMESDLQGNWRGVGPQFLGTGGVVRQRVDTARPAQFYKAESFAVRDLNATLGEIRARRGLPALACAVVLSDRIVGIGATGARKQGIAAPVTIADKWHIGSLTKSMTATLAAILVEEGKIRWTDTLATIFPDLAPTMVPHWRGITLEQLTANRAGVPGTVTATMWNDFGAAPGRPRDARRYLTRRMSSELPLNATPGTRYEYSNLGFAIAGHMLETVAGKPWEELIVEKLFQPLGMAAVGFGAPGTPRYLDHPLGHSLATPTTAPGAANLMTAFDPGMTSDNTPAIAPAGTLNCTLLDMAAYMMFQLRANRAGTELLPQAAALKLHTAVPNNNNYAHGWGVYARTWADGEALHHTGTNLKWYSDLWLAPKRGFGVIIFCNLGGDTARAALDEVAGRMVQDFLR